MRDTPFPSQPLLKNQAVLICEKCRINQHNLHRTAGIYPVAKYLAMVNKLEIPHGCLL